MRIVNYPNVNKMRIYEQNALKIAGPVDFRQTVIGDEEYDPEILLMAYDLWVPGAIGRYPYEDRCTKW